MPTSPNDSSQTNWYPAPVPVTQQNVVGEDEQLTIKIPNPKVFMARQSQWVGRRGKPRCDSCRQDNLKCDRQRPACNHCSWGSGKECKYTPLPTPAHRGIPRCDRCRLENLKCDRNLPICNFCTGGVEPCNYTPKRRQKTSADDDKVEQAEEDSDEAQEVLENHTEIAAYYDRNIPSSSNQHGKHPSLISSNTDEGLLKEHTGLGMQIDVQEIGGKNLQQLPSSAQTPTHRGIPRCDQCRSKNLKCNRGLPACNNCTREGGCTYSPRGRYKAPPTNDQNLGQVEDNSNEAREIPSGTQPHQTENAGYYKQHTPSASHNSHGTDHAPLPFTWEDSYQPERPRYATSSRSKTYDTLHGMPSLPPIAPRLPAVLVHTSDLIRDESTSRRVSSIPSAYVEPWYNPHFAPIPEYVVRSLRVISRATVPSRTEFDEALLMFQQNVMVELRETMCFTPAVYATISVALKNWGSEPSEISDYTVRWINIHWAGSGSAKFHLILTPRLSDRPMGRSEVEDLRSGFVKYYDRRWFAWTKTFPAILQDLSPENEEHMVHFDRVPVQPQIYDLLTYAHRAHGDAREILAEIRHIGYGNITWPMAEIYINMCPVCSSR